MRFGLQPVFLTCFPVFVTFLTRTSMYALLLGRHPPRHGGLHRELASGLLRGLSGRHVAERHTPADNPDWLSFVNNKLLLHEV